MIMMVTTIDVYYYSQFYINVCYMTQFQKIFFVAKTVSLLSFDVKVRNAFITAAEISPIL